MPILLDLFLTFLKIGAVSFGGGYGMIPLITEEVTTHGWLSQTEILNFIAVSESTPGPISINMATFIGSSQGGILGALVATFGVVLPAFLVILLIASVMQGLLKFAGVANFLKGIRPVVIGLIVATGVLMLVTVMFGISKIGDEMAFDYKGLIILLIIGTISISYRVLRKKSLSPLILIAISALLGMLLYGVMV